MSRSARQLRRQRQAYQRKVVKQMRNDMLYIIKPRPRFLPNRLWLFLLKKLINRTPDSIKINS